MKVVAASKLRRAQNAISGARPFAHKVEEITLRMLSEILEEKKLIAHDKAQAFLESLHPLLKTPNLLDPNTGRERNKKVGLLVVSADRGLCGAYNSNVLRFAWRYYQELKAHGNVDIKLFFGGKRGYDHFAKRGIPGMFFADIFTGRLTSTKTDAIAKVITQQFLNGEIDSFKVIYTEFKSALVQTVTLKKLLPLDISVDGVARLSNALSPPYIYEPSQEELVRGLISKQVSTQFYKVFADSFASELGSKMTAMDNATRNAGKMISSLTLTANRVRQAAITTELMEIIGGAEALKG